MGGQVAPKALRGAEEVDRFFVCLDDLDNSPPLVGANHAHENGKGFFSMGFGLDDQDDMPPFVLPNDVGVEVQEILPSPHSLEAVMEEEELEEEEEEEDEVEELDDDAVFDEEISGIRITFTPPEPEHDELQMQIPTIPVATVKPIPVFESSDEDDDDDDEAPVPFNFGRPAPGSVQTVSTNYGRSISPKADPSVPNRNVASPSSIPRYSPARSFIASSDVITSTPPKATPTRFVVPTGYSANGFVTPPSKRGGMMPSFIPQPVSSATPIRCIAPNKPRTTPTTTFIRQPQSKPGPGASFKHGSTFRPTSSNLRQQNQITCNHK